MGEKITIYDIARTAEVSPATVSRMINHPDIVTEETREKILEAFAECGIRPEDLTTKKRQAYSSRRAAGSGQTVMVSIPNIGNPFYNDILEGIHDYLKMNHYHTIITTEIPQRNTMQSFLNYCASLQIAGIIVMYPLSEDFLRQLKAAYPLVQCSEYNPLYQNVPYVSIDDYSSSKMAVDLLIRKGSRRIGFFTTSYEFRYTQNRYRAYKSMLDSHGLEMRPEYVIQAADFDYERILNAAERYFTLPEPPDAVFAVSDSHAHAVVKAGMKHGLRIPEDLKVFGFDDTIYATLSTVKDARILSAI
ncbi:MAG: LacI family transcriptional regulator [Clostridiales bacterium]|nr:LacI family transcriptional regulator [Clostridiales bacterium]